MTSSSASICSRSSPLIPEALTPLAVVAFMVLGLRGLTGGRLSRRQTVMLLSGVSLAVAVIIRIS